MSDDEPRTRYVLQPRIIAATAEDEDLRERPRIAGHHPAVRAR